MTTGYDLLLREAWDKFCDELKQAGEVVFRDTSASNPVDRAVGVRYLARNIALALQFHLENNDPAHPELLRYYDPLRKQGGDNTDAMYVGAPINGSDTYRISGTRGSASYFGVTVVEQGDTPWGGGVAGVLFGDQIQMEPDGTFEVFLSPDPQPGNWIKTTPESFRVTVRQFFADWVNEEPMEARIDILSGDGKPPQLTPEKVATGLADSAHWLGWSTRYWAEMIGRWKVRPNEFLSYRELDDNKIDATPGGDPMVSFWSLPADEAVIIRVTPPEARYWAVEFGNFWWETMDYRYRLANTNCHQAVLEDDGELILVIAHDDPGVPNWLDPSGHSEGYVTLRWMLASSCPVPQAQQVKRADLFQHLPEAVRRIGSDERQVQLADRRTGVLKRFKW